MGVDVVDAFLDAVDAAARLVSDPSIREGWERPSALEGFTVGGLVGHLYAATRRTEVVLEEATPDAPSVVGLGEFYGANRVEDGDDLAQGLHRFVRDDGERRAERGPVVVAGEFAELARRLRADIPGVPLDRRVAVIQVPGGATRLDTYLETRVVELVVHMDDLAVSVDLDSAPIPPTAASVALGVCLELARSRNGDVETLRAFARRERANPDALRVF